MIKQSGTMPLVSGFLYTKKSKLQLGKPSKKLCPFRYSQTKLRVVSSTCSIINRLKCLVCLQEKYNNILAANSLENLSILCFQKSISQSFV